MSGSGGLRLREGMSLVEALTAMVLVSLVLMGLVPTLFHAMRQQKIDAVALERTAVLMAETNRLLTMAFPTLDAQQGCSSVASPAAFPHELCVTVDPVSTRERKVVVVVTPERAAVEPDSIVISRTLPVTGNPFNTAAQP